MAAIFIASSTSNPLGIRISTVDPTGFSLHLLEYLVLAILLVLSLMHSFRGYRAGYLIALGICISILYGCTDEIHQFFIPGRASDLWDIVADGIGAIIGGLIGWRICMAEGWVAVTLCEARK